MNAFLAARVAAAVVDPERLDEKSPHEPEEFDPESLGPETPETDAPGDGVAPEVPSAPEFDAEDLDPEVGALFWKLVLVFNASVFALAVGPMVAYFLGDVRRGGLIFAVGLAGFAYGVVRYYQFQRNRDEDAA